MKIFPLVLTALMVAANAFAENVQIQIEAKFQGFAVPLFPDSRAKAKSTNRDDVLSAPTVVTKAGQSATIEIVREVAVPSAANNKGMTQCGVSLEILPEVHNGKITLSGKSIVRRQSQPGERQPLQAVTFVARETYFSGRVVDGKPVTLHVGDGPKDSSRITLTARKVEPPGVAVK